MAFFDIITLVEAVLMVFSIYLKLISNGVKSVCSDVQFFSHFSVHEKWTYRVSHSEMNDSKWL